MASLHIIGVHQKIARYNKWTYFSTSIQLLVSEGKDDIFHNGEGQHKAKSTRSPQKSMLKHIAAFQEMILHGNDDAHNKDSGSVSSPTVGNMTLFSLHHLLTAHEP